MDFNINIYNLIIGFGMLQGFIFGALLFRKSRYNEAQKYLGITVLFLSFYLLWVLKYDYGFQKQFPFLGLLPVLFLWGIGPAFYSYLRFYIGKPISAKLLKWYFLPLAIEFAYFNTCTLIQWQNDWKWANFNQLEFALVSNLFNVEHIVGLTIIGLYLMKSIKLLYNQHEITYSVKIRYMLFFFTFLWLIWVPYSIYDLIYYNFDFPPSGFYLFYILFTVLTYCIGFFGFRLNSSIDYKESTSKGFKNKISVTPEMRELATEIDCIMRQEKHYLNPKLSLRDFGLHVGAHPNKISTVINTVIGQSFRDFVNSYRIIDFKSRLESYDIEHKTILGLAYEVGFNSKASFNRVFKNTIGDSPIEYLEKIKKSKSQNI